MNYSAHYDHLIERARNRTLDCYSERHHIVPRCVGGRDDADNLVRLTPEEHFVAHQLLVKIHPKSRGVVFAAIAMTFGGAGKRINNKRFGWLRRKHSWALKNMSAVGRAKLSALQMGNKRGLGHKVSEEQRVAMIGNKYAVGNKSSRMLGKVHSIETKAKMSCAHMGNQTARGYKCTPEQIARRSLVQTERRARERKQRIQDSSAV